MEQDLENVVFDQVATAATGPADTLFTEPDAYTGETFSAASEVKSWDEGTDSPYMKHQFGDSRVKTTKSDFKSALTSKIFGDITSGTHVPEHLQTDESYEDKSGFGYGIVSSPEFAGEGRTLFSGVGSDFAMDVTFASRGEGTIGDYSVDDIVTEYSNPESEIWAEGGIGGSWINPHVKYEGEHDLEGDKFWLRDTDYLERSGETSYVDEIEPLYRGE